MRAEPVKDDSSGGGGGGGGGGISSSPGPGRLPRSLCKPSPMVFPEAQPLLEPAEDLESPAAPSPRPAAYSDAIERLRDFKQDPAALKVRRH